MKSFGVRARVDGYRKSDHFTAVDKKHGLVSISQVELLNIAQGDMSVDMFVKPKRGSMVMHLEFFVPTASGRRQVGVTVDASSFCSGKISKRAVSVKELL